METGTAPALIFKVRDLLKKSERRYDGVEVSLRNFRDWDDRGRLNIVNER